ncbi:hypothetical protein BKA62DRAFT_257751 [Auriculariales sp. MPI-PUGE-AT-0066]|nr:hypothetical protein BKA62DRAFT_257751 [Auriculariales sp. MPI-PUGE-AT-0066]
MSFFRRKDDSIPPAPDYNSGSNKLQRPPPPQDRYGSSGQQQPYGGQDRYGAPPPDRYGAPPQDRYGAPPPDRYGAAPDRYGQQPQPQRYGGGQQQQQPPPGGYGQQGSYGQQQQQQPDRYARGSPAPASDRYGQNGSPGPAAGGYGSRQRVTAGDPYSRGQGDLDADRAALFAGRNPEAPRRLESDGPRGGGGNYTNEAELDRRRAEGGDEEEDVESIKKDIRSVKQDSLASTRNALRIAREAEETGMSTLIKLGDQSEKLGDAERHIDVAKYNSQKASDKVDELKQLNKSIFRPVIVFNKDKKRAAQEAKMLARHNEQKDEHERVSSQVRDTQNRIGNVAMSRYEQDGYGDGSGDGMSAPARGGMGGSRGYGTSEQDRVRKEQRKRYQFEATASDDELEDGIDENLDGISSAVANMKKIALAMGQEVDSQNKSLDAFSNKVDKADALVVTNTNRLRKY